MEYNPLVNKVLEIQIGPSVSNPIPFIRDNNDILALEKLLHRVITDVLDLNNEYFTTFDSPPVEFEIKENKRYKKDKSLRIDLSRKSSILNGSITNKKTKLRDNLPIECNSYQLRIEILPINPKMQITI